MTAVYKVCHRGKFFVWPLVTAGLLPRTGADWISLNVTDVIAVVLQQGIWLLFGAVYFC